MNEERTIQTTVGKKRQPRQRFVHVCAACGHTSARWMGRCPACEEWDTMVEEAVPSARPNGSGRGYGTDGAGGRPEPLAEVSTSAAPRLVSGWSEFDRVLGGGIVGGSLVLVAGEPGMGKSTLMLMVAERLQAGQVLYVAGEESPRQIKMRADRLGISARDIHVFAETDVARIADAVTATEPRLVIIDSIQTVHSSDVPAGPGSVIQIRSCAVALQRLAKQMEVPVLLVGHVTKEGVIAGPKVLEHTVDAVVQFEGDRHHSFRVLRAVKNRFGSTNEIGVFEMSGVGLREVENPSARFLACRRAEVSGSVVISAVEGTRPVLIEMQALVSDRAYGTPQRTATGFAMRRLQMLIAVLARRANVRLADHDVFVNAVAGARVDEPAADAGVLLALASAARDRPVAADTVVIGEVGLAGELRPVHRMEQRIAEAARLGFRRVVIPSENQEGDDQNKSVQSIGLQEDSPGCGSGIEVIGVADVAELLGTCLADRQ